MRLSIRAEQMSALELEAQEKFVSRIKSHLLAEYPQAAVILPGEETFTVDTLPKETLTDLVRISIARARTFEMTFESSISAFSALMFEIAPNFHTNRVCQVVFNDEAVEPNEQIDLVLSMLSPDVVKSMKENYDPNAWKLDEAPQEGKQPAVDEGLTAKPAEPGNFDNLATVKISSVEQK